MRRAVRKAAKVGVVVKRAELDEQFLDGIVSIYNETPVRQGKPFWHFQKDRAVVMREASTYPERNHFLGAYYGDELIGFMRLIYVDRTASVIQILSKVAHFDKRPTNAMIAKAVEICEQEGRSHLVFCKYVYNDPESSLTEFKRRNGFEQVLVPRYYVPLTRKGKLALKLGFHRGFKAQIPKRLMTQLLKVRNYWYERKLRAVKATA